MPTYAEGNLANEWGVWWPQNDSALSFAKIDKLIDQMAEEAIRGHTLRNVDINEEDTQDLKKFPRKLQCLPHDSKMAKSPVCHHPASMDYRWIRGYRINVVCESKTP